MQHEQEQHESSAQKFGKDIMVIVGGVLQRVEYTPISSDAKPCVKNALRCNCCAHRSSSWRLKDKDFKLTYDFVYEEFDSSEAEFWETGHAGPRLLNNKGLPLDEKLLVELSDIVEFFEFKDMESMIVRIKTGIRHVHRDMLSRCRIIEAHQIFSNTQHEFNQSRFLKAVKANVLDARIADHLASKGSCIEFDLDLPLIDYGGPMMQYLSKVERMEKYLMQWTTTHFYKDEITYLLMVLHIFQLLIALKPKCACQECELYAAALEEHSYLVKGMLGEGRIMVLYRRVAEYEAAQCSTDSEIVAVDGLDMDVLEEHFRSDISAALSFVPALIQALCQVFCEASLEHLKSEQEKGSYKFDCVAWVEELVSKCQRWYGDVIGDETDTEETEGSSNRFTDPISEFENLSG